MEGDPMTSGNLLRDVYEEVSRGNPRPLLEALADDVSWTIIGTAPLSGTYKGKDAVIAGEPYNNTYCIVAHVVDGRFVELTDYVDTDLMRRVLLDAP